MKFKYDCEEFNLETTVHDIIVYHGFIEGCIYSFVEYAEEGDFSLEYGGNLHLGRFLYEDEHNYMIQDGFEYDGEVFHSEIDLVDHITDDMLKTLH